MNSILRKTKCIVCGRRLQVAKRQSHKAGKKIVGYCYNQKHPRIKITIIDSTKKSDDVDADVHLDVNVNDSEY